MTYYISKTIKSSFEDAIQRVTYALQKHGFGVVTELNMHTKFKEKLDISFRKYTILGACSPAHAHQALTVEDKIGTMLPCNVIVQEQAENTIEVAAVNPKASMMAVENKNLALMAEEIEQTLQEVINSL
ncbi:MAG: DUF302 domain-containing protein [Bacteroidales bacterium]|jgi:uncharacterized protein (DUF302 family)|nr:DUF302 domain-containing protein [Bacteroidales bacterium]